MVFIGASDDAASDTQTHREIICENSDKTNKNSDENPSEIFLSGFSTRVRPSNLACSILFKYANAIFICRSQFAFSFSSF